MSHKCARCGKPVKRRDESYCSRACSDQPFRVATVDVAAVLRDVARVKPEVEPLAEIARRHRISRPTMARILKERCGFIHKHGGDWSGRERERREWAPVFLAEARRTGKNNLPKETDA